MTFQSVGRILNVNHATIIHGNKQCKNYLTLNYREYTDSMLNWRIIFDEHHLDIEEEVNTFTRVRNRIRYIIEDSILYAGLTEDEAQLMLKEMLTEFELDEADV